MYMKHSNILSLTSNVEKVSCPNTNQHKEQAETDKFFTRNFMVTRKSFKIIFTP